MGKEYSLGPLSVSDVSSMATNKLKELFSKEIKDVEKFVEQLRQGETSALIVAGVSLGVGAWLAYLVFYRIFLEEAPKPRVKKEVEPIVLRDFTREQLRDFNGESDGKIPKPVYIGLCGEVYDATAAAANYYGPGAGYHCFAGRDASRAMAKYCFDEKELSNPNISDLGPFERSMLESWVQKFKYYKCYPVVGKMSEPPVSRVFTREELKAFNGTQEVPKDRVDAPIYVALGGKVFDVSYGGKEMYEPEGPYAMFAGLDASRALAKMSFDDADINSYDLSDLEEKQKQTLADWLQKFEHVKKYPVVGTIAE